MPQPLPPQRHLFDLSDDIAYLNCAYFTPQPNRVRDAGRRAIDAQSHPWEVTAPDFFGPGEDLRNRFASLVSGDADGVALIPSVSYGVGVAAANVRLGSGRTIVVLDEQFPSDVYPWRAKVEAEGGAMVTVPPPAGGSWTTGVLEAIDESTAVVAVPNCHWTDGRAVDLEAVGEAVRSVGATLVVDASQSLGAHPLDVSVVRPDYLISVGYKWLFGPYSLGYLWVAPEHRGGVPLEQTWMGRLGSEDFTRLVDYTDDFQRGARRFDVGEWSNFTLVPMALAALGLVEEWGPENVAASLAPLTSRLEVGSAGLGLDPVRSESRLAHLMGVRFHDGIPAGLRDALAAAGVYVSLRSDAVRVAPHLFNTTGDIDRLLEVFDSVL